MSNPPKINRLNHILNSTASTQTPISANAAPPDAVLPSGLPKEEVSINPNAQTTSSVSPTNMEDRIKDEQTRIRKAILILRNQVRNPSIMDQFLSCLSTTTAIDGRLPFTPKRVITTQDKAMLLHNLVGHAILTWGMLARAEYDDPESSNPYLLELEEVAKIGMASYGAYPKERNSAIYVLRTITEERRLFKDRQEREEKALERKAHIRAGGLDDGEDKTEGNVGGGVVPAPTGLGSSPISPAANEGGEIGEVPAP